MRNLLTLSLCVAAAAFAQGVGHRIPAPGNAYSVEVLLTTTPALITRHVGTRSVELFNKSAATVYCSFVLQVDGGNAQNSRQIISGQVWAMELPDSSNLYCSASAAQSATTGTQVTELP